MEAFRTAADRILNIPAVDENNNIIVESLNYPDYFSYSDFYDFQSFRLFRDKILTKERLALQDMYDRPGMVPFVRTKLWIKDLEYNYYSREYLESYASNLGLEVVKPPGSDCSSKEGEQRFVPNPDTPPLLQAKRKEAIFDLECTKFVQNEREKRAKQRQNKQ
ncbi:uncharacterized protein LOC110184183 [Drosophila serrata]|uniref:uncharacterized protein LOC110184183 n=1 Tax=Drosophila serrata TaxID=7274 RepID=UPI000A1D3A2A|nr:uncharacterized protein LOC110184183 [Drosophila serrata]